jgi:hypothetical protein
MKKFILIIICLSSFILFVTKSTVNADQNVQFCVVFPDGHLGQCADTLYNCNVVNSNKHMGAVCVPMPKQ